MTERYKLDPRFARDVVRPPRGTAGRNNEPPKVDPKFARESVGASAPPKIGCEPPKVAPEFAREYVGREAPKPLGEPATRHVAGSAGPSETASASIREMSGHRFEEVVVSLFSKAGITVMHTTRARDHGLDAVVFVGGEKLGVQICRG